MEVNINKIADVFSAFFGVTGSCNNEWLPETIKTSNWDP